MGNDLFHAVFPGQDAVGFQILLLPRAALSAPRVAGKELKCIGPDAFRFLRHMPESLSGGQMAPDPQFRHGARVVPGTLGCISVKVL